MSNTLSLPRQLATLIGISSMAHSELGKKSLDRGGEPYILHPMRIMNAVGSKFEGDFRYKVMMVAIAHDLIEDTHWTIEDLRARQITDEDVLEALTAITKTDDVSYFYYIANIRLNKLAKEVKKEDIQDNSLMTRLKGVTDKDFKRTKKYHASYMFLSGKMDLSEYKDILETIDESLVK